MVYVDTSGLIPMFVREASSDAVVAWVESAGLPLAISDWTRVEFASALSIKARSGAIDAALARSAIKAMGEFAATACSVFTPRAEEFQRAADLCSDGSSALRGGVALHLAIAEALKVQAILCLDDAMSERARRLNIPVVKF